MSAHSHEHGHRLRYARGFLLVAFALQRMGDAAVIWFAFLPKDSTLLLRGAAAGGCLWTIVLFVGVWRQLRWARYVLTTFNWGYMAFFTFWMLRAWEKRELTAADPTIALIAGVALYGLANFILLRSRRVRHYASHTV